jgi:hypothetical protein
MLRKITVIAMVSILALASMAGAAERKGEFALGFSNADAPVGIRYFTSDKVGLDLGLGFESQDLGEDSGTSFWVEGGVTYVVYDYNDSFFFVRPAVTYASLNDGVYGGGDVDESWSQFTVALNLGAEVRLAERFGLQFQHGLGFVSTSPPGDGDSLTDFGTFGENVTQAGVWFTF